MSERRENSLALSEQPHASSKEETTAGSYFVSNYPPYSFWSGDHVDDVRMPSTGLPVQTHL